MPYFLWKYSQLYCFFIICLLIQILKIIKMFFIWAFKNEQAIQIVVFANELFY